MTDFPATALPFDVEEILARLTRWAACESPTFDAAAVNRMMDLAARDLALLGARIDRIPGRMGLGDCVRARFPHPAGDAAPGICVMAHLDTVHPVGTLAKLPIRREGEPLLRPGHPRHEGRHRDQRGGDPPDPRRRHADEAAGHLPADQRRGDRQPLDARHHRGRGVAQHATCWCPNRHARWRRGDRALRHRALQPEDHRAALACRRAPGRRAQRDPRDGEADRRHRGR